MDMDMDTNNVMFKVNVYWSNYFVIGNWDILFNYFFDIYVYSSMASTLIIIFDVVGIFFCVNLLLIEFKFVYKLQLIDNYYSSQLIYL